MDWSTAEVFLATDAGHANVSEVVIHYDDQGEATKLTKEPFHSQKGRVVGISTPMTKDGEMNVCVMEWKSHVEKRVCRSTLAPGPTRWRAALRPLSGCECCCRRADMSAFTLPSGASAPRM